MGIIQTLNIIADTFRDRDPWPIVGVGDRADPVASIDLALISFESVNDPADKDAGVVGVKPKKIA